MSLFFSTLALHVYIPTRFRDRPFFSLSDWREAEGRKGTQRLEVRNRTKTWLKHGN